MNDPDGSDPELETDSGRIIEDELPKAFREARSRVMYIEDKSEGLEGPGCIGRVYFSKSGNTLYYKGQRFRSLKGRGYKANYFDVETGDWYWISGPRADLDDRLYGGNEGVVVDDDVEEAYTAYLAGERGRAK